MIRIYIGRISALFERLTIVYTIPYSNFYFADSGAVLEAINVIVTAVL